MTSHPLLLRPAFATNYLEPPPPYLPALISLPTSFITFCHPGYAYPANILFRLPAYDACEFHGSNAGDTLDTDHLNDASLVWGVQHGIAVQACSIIACNLDGVLSSTIVQRGPGEGACFLPDTLDWDSLLTAKVYYFYPRAWFESGSGRDLVYPVCPSFSDWQFPHDLLPRQWVDVYKYTDPVPRVPKPSQYSAAVMLRDGTCRVTNFDDCTETSHIIPKKECDWFARNAMDIYNRNPSLPNNLWTSDMENLICLRCDMHSQFDSANMVFVPKSQTSRIHFLRETRQYGSMLHNRETEKFRISPEFLYARFAWAVLPLAQGFAAKVDMKVRVWNAELKAWEDRLNQAEPDSAPRSPRKRMRLSQRSQAPPAANSSAAQDDIEMAFSEDGLGSPTAQEAKVVASADNNVLMPSTPPRPALSGHNSLPSPTWTPRIECERRTKIFDHIVSRDPDSAWESLYWHPDAERLEVMKDAYLRAHEPLHEQEIKRQLKIVESGCGLYDGEAIWQHNGAFNTMVSDDESE